MKKLFVTSVLSLASFAIVYGQSEVVNIEVKGKIESSATSIEVADNVEVYKEVNRKDGQVLYAKKMTDKEKTTLKYAEVQPIANSKKRLVRDPNSNVTVK